MRKLILAGLIVAVISAAGAAQAQENLTVSFSDPSRPGLLKVNLLSGGIAVKGYAGKDVIVTTRASSRKRPPEQRTDGLRRIDSNAMGITIEEENNVMSITSRNFNGSGDIEIQAPVKTNLNLKTLNGGDVTVDGIEGEIEVTNTNGGVELTNVTGSVVAHSMNGRVLASLREITADKPMSFTSMNGNVDVTLPSTLKANLRMRTDNGGAYSDFDIQLRPNAPATVQDSRDRGGRIRIQTDKTITGTVNGGGPDIELRTLNGNIYIRKGK